MEAVTDASFNLGWPLGWPGLIWEGGGHGHPGCPLRTASDCKQVPAVALRA
jgi:hypothetical protein